MINLSKIKKPRTFDFAKILGKAPEGIRTPDPRITNALLYRLSHGSILIVKKLLQILATASDPSGNRTRV